MSLLDVAPDHRDATPILGFWVSSSPASSGIRSVEISSSGDGEIELRVQGAGANGNIDWGTTHAELFPCTEEDRQPSVCLFATYDHGFMHCELQLRVNKGVISFTTFNTFSDASGRCDYVIRELFHRRDDTEGTAP